MRAIYFPRYFQKCIINEANLFCDTIPVAIATSGSFADNRFFFAKLKACSFVGGVARVVVLGAYGKEFRVSFSTEKVPVDNWRLYKRRLQFLGRYTSRDVSERH